MEAVWPFQRKRSFCKELSVSVLKGKRKHSPQILSQKVKHEQEDKGLSAMTALINETAARSIVNAGPAASAALGQKLAAEARLKLGFASRTMQSLGAINKVKT